MMRFKFSPSGTPVGMRARACKFDCYPRVSAVALGIDTESEMSERKLQIDIVSDVV